MPFPQLTSTPGFRITTWDPLLIISQIICLQTLYYSTLCFILLFLDILLGYTVSLDQVLLFEEVRFDTATGWGVALAYILTAGMGTIYQLHLLTRSKLCLDFSTTLHIIHLCLVRLHSHAFPTTFSWYFIFISSWLIWALGGEWVCMRRELEPIVLSNAASNTRAKKRDSLMKSDLELEPLGRGE